MAQQQMTAKQFMTLIMALQSESNKRIQETNKRIEENNKRMDERMAESNKRMEESNKRIEETNKRIDASNKKIADSIQEQKREFMIMTKYIDENREALISTTQPLSSMWKAIKGLFQRRFFSFTRSSSQSSPSLNTPKKEIILKKQRGQYLPLSSAQQDLSSRDQLNTQLIVGNSTEQYQTGMTKQIIKKEMSHNVKKNNHKRQQQYPNAKQSDKMECTDLKKKDDKREQQCMDVKNKNNKREQQKKNNKRKQQ